MAEIAEPSQKLGSYQGMTGLDAAVHPGVPLDRPSLLENILCSFMLSFIEIVYRILLHSSPLIH